MTEVDVVVIGAGAAGLAAAKTLARAGQTVTVGQCFAGKGDALRNRAHQGLASQIAGRR